MSIQTQTDEIFEQADQIETGLLMITAGAMAAMGLILMIMGLLNWGVAAAVIAVALAVITLKD